MPQGENPFCQTAERRCRMVIRKALTHKQKNSHFHGSNCTNNPAIRLPNVAPMGAVAPKKPTVMFRVLPGGNVIVSKAIAFGTIRAPPIPLRARMTDSVITLLMKPETRWKMTQITAAATTVFLWP